MLISKKTFEKIKEFEGCRLNAYLDMGGTWTIGYGHTGKVMRGDRISQQQADELLEEDIMTVERQLLALKDAEVGEWTKGQWDAVVCFVFNVGIGNYQKSLLRKAIMQKKDAYVIDKLWRSWSHVKGTWVSGLAKRRNWELERFFEESEPWDKNY